MQSKLEKIQSIIEQLQSTNSRLDKESILSSYKEDEDFIEILKRTYDSELKYGVTSKSCLDDKMGGLTVEHDLDLYTLLDKLESRELSGHNAIGHVNYFAENNESGEIIYCIIDKDLKCGISIGTINKVIPGCITSVKIQLAERMDKVKNSAIKMGRWFLSEKIDGQRCFCMMIEPTEENGFEKIKFYARGGDRLGKEIKTLDNLKSQMLTFYNKDNQHYVIEGEIIIEKQGRNNLDNCRYTASQMRRGSRDNPEQVLLDDGNGNILKYKLFDCVHKEDFFTESGKRSYQERYWDLKRRQLDCKQELVSNIEVLEQEKITIDTFEKFEEVISKPVPEGIEGYILRRDCEYKGKRSMDMIKIKKKDRMELEIYDIELTTKPMLDEEGVMQDVECLGALFGKGVNEIGETIITKIGTGFTNEQRLLFMDSKEIVGKTITVEYSEVSENQEGTKSLRGPVFVCIRENNE